MSGNWLDFWGKYRRVDAKSESDLYYQVGKTIDKEPIDRGVFERMLRSIRTRLKLNSGDHLIDLCCGNGLVTFELARYVRRVSAVDFAEHLIAAAEEFKSRSNIQYVVGDVAVALGLDRKDPPSKFLMNDALAYFDPKSLGDILDNVLSAVGQKGFHFLITGIPEITLKWNFYDTPERRARHLEAERINPGTNDGLGRWWGREEIESECRQRNLSVRIDNQPGNISTYRMDALISALGK